MARAMLTVGVSWARTEHSLGAMGGHPLGAMGAVGVSDDDTGLEGSSHGAGTEVKERVMTFQTPLQDHT